MIFFDDDFDFFARFASNSSFNFFQFLSQLTSFFFCILDAVIACDAGVSLLELLEGMGQ